MLGANRGSIRAERMIAITNSVALQFFDESRPA